VSRDRVKIRGERRQAAICPFCREAAQGLAGLECPDCGTRYHRACAEEMGGCATLGCRGAEIGRLRLRMRWRDEDHDGFLARWDRPASERPAPPPAPESAGLGRRQLSLLRLAWMQLDGLRFLVGTVFGLVALAVALLLPPRGEAAWPRVVVGGALLLYFGLSGAYGANPWWWPTRRREWWE
jgi:hypothetical protein